MELADQTVTCITGADGRWQVKLRPPAASGPHTLRIIGPQTVEFRDVLVGEVWLCGGQSNMQLRLQRARNGEEEVRTARKIPACGER
jgi:sialate O-acetylesterase